MDRIHSAAPSRYTRTAIWLHWAIAALVLTTIPIGWYGAAHDIPRGEAAMGLHKSLGIVILALTLGRVWWRLHHRPPALPASLRPIMRGIANATHAMFYVLPVILPLSGWWMVSAQAQRRPFGLGVIDAPFLPVPRGSVSAATAHSIHVNLAWLMIGLAGLHILAVLKHVVFDDDAAVVSRMLPADD